MSSPLSRGKYEGIISVTATAQFIIAGTAVQRVIASSPPLMDIPSCSAIHPVVATIHFSGAISINIDCTQHIISIATLEDVRVIVTGQLVIVIRPSQVRNTAQPVAVLRRWLLQSPATTPSVSVSIYQRHVLYSGAV